MNLFRPAALVLALGGLAACTYVSEQPRRDPAPAAVVVPAAPSAAVVTPAPATTVTVR
ncbi:hypothetical protein ACI6QG_16935 [Roseococcus sp. DSY-14]|uniref:hypothetical protein n=1 Tax=Roseococcus sp. DSY-14 TaxID=3369650 RepID=UPI00387ADFCC